jgi:tetratricopeptide (TPR) repeat protein
MRAASEPPAKPASEPPPRAPSQPPMRAASDSALRVASSRPPAPSNADDEATPLSIRDLELAETSVEEVSLSDVTVATIASADAAMADAAAVEAAAALTAAVEPAPESLSPDDMQEVEETPVEVAPVSLDPELLEEAPTSSDQIKTKSYRPKPKPKDEGSDPSRTAATLPPSAARKKSPAEAASVPPAAPEQRSSSLSMIVLAAVVAIGFVGAIAYLSGPQQNTQSTPPTSSAVPQLTRVVEAEQALADGDLGSAEEKLHAIAQTDPNPRVLVGLARVANARADRAWLTLRLVKPGSSEEGAARDRLRDLAKKAREAAEAAVVAAPSDPAAVRAKLDALRIANEIEAARALVDMVTNGRPSEPETDYVLAALDLGEASPPLPEITARLRAAAEREGKLARARSALVYALAMSGDLPAAQGELEKLAKITPPHPLLDLLRSTARGTAPSGSASAMPSAIGTAPTVTAVNATPNPHAHATAATLNATVASPASAGSAPITMPTDVGGLQRAATAARRKGDLPRAQQLYEELLRKTPGDSDALTGLGDTLRAQGDSAGAIAKYRPPSP